MANKIWHKSLHTRKNWKTLTTCQKTAYYLQPFVGHLSDIWIQPLPFPSILKLFLTFLVVLIASIPILYPSLILMWTYGEMQYLIERNFGIQYPIGWDLLEYLKRVFNLRIINDSHAMFLSLYIMRWRLLATAITSSIDYIRLACYFVLGIA